MIPVIKASRVAVSGVQLRQHPRRLHAPVREHAGPAVIGERLAGGGAAPRTAAEETSAGAPADVSAGVPPDPYALGYDAGFAAGRREGWDAGREQGQHAGLEQGRQDADDAAAVQASAMEALGATIAEACTRRSAAIEAAAIEIAFAALLRLIGHSAGDVAVVADTVQRVLEQAPERMLQAIRLSPADHALLAQGGHGLNLGSALLVADERVSVGGCIVDTDAGSLDGRLETQLAELKTLLVGLHRAQGAQP